MASQKPIINKKPNRNWVLWAIALTLVGLLTIKDKDGVSYPEPNPIIYTDTIKTKPKIYDKEDWKGHDDDSLRELYDPNHSDYNYDPNDPNRGEWQGYYE